MPGVKPCAGGQVLRELLGLLWIEAQKHSNDGTRTSAPLDAAMVNAITQTDTSNDLRMLLDLLQPNGGCTYSSLNWAAVSERSGCLAEDLPSLFIDLTTSRGCASGSGPRLCWSVRWGR